MASIRSLEAVAAPESVLDPAIVKRLSASISARAQDHDAQEILQALPAAVYVTDENGRITFFNEAAAELWGVRPRPGESEFCGSWKLYWPDGTPLPHDECPMALALKEKRPIRGMEAVAERPDGSRVDFIPYPTPFFDAAGELTGAVNMLVDITERKRSERALRQSEERLAKELDAARRLQEISSLLIQENDSDALYDRILDAAVAIMSSDMASMQVVDEDENALRLLTWRGFGPEYAELFRLVRPDAGTAYGTVWDLGRRVVVPDVESRAYAVGTPALEIHRRMDVRAVQSTPLVSRVGKLLGVISTYWRKPYDPSESDLQLLDVLARQAADLLERSQAEQEARYFAAIVESSHDAIVSKNLNSVIRSWNESAERLFGYTAAEVVGKPITILIPEDRLGEEPAIIERIADGERVDHFETMRRRKDGSLVELSLTISPVKNAKGEIIGASNIARDITERRNSEEQMNLLLREMNHRVKNLFSLASGIVSLSARSPGSPEEFARELQQRLRALARAHELTLPNLTNKGASIDASTTLDVLLQTILLPFADEGGGDARAVVDGPVVPIGSGAVTNIALLLHEFATNAAKYGALASPSGRVRVEWVPSADGIALTWSETGGPPLAGEPEREGFGSRLAVGMAAQLGGRISREWRPEGLVIHLTIPTDRLAA